jgi:hypothetical protein
VWSDSAAALRDGRAERRNSAALDLFLSRMRLTTAITGAITCAAIGAAAPALAASAPPAKSPEGVYVSHCNKVDRTAVFLGRMRAIQNSHEMWMRFALQERVLPGKAFAPLTVPGLEVWHKSRPDVRRFGFRQRVRALAEAAIYKVDVAFRWYDAEGNLLRETLKRSRRCRQPGALPNLQIDRIGRRPSGQYYVRVGNVGRDVATGVSVQLFVDGEDAGLVSLPDLLPDAIRGSLFTGPGCEGSVQAVVDPAASLRESSEDDNALTVPCADLE